MENLARRSIATPIGRIGLIGTADALARVLFPADLAEREQRSSPELPLLLTPDQKHPAAALLAEAAEQFSAYIAGERREFSLPLAPVGTPWQLQVWQGLRAIPYGQRWSYGQLASSIGRPTAARAVGSANGRNPLPIVIPCHRVIAAHGLLGGFSGGLDIKTWLLDLESSKSG
ncbi:MAG: methylated-DNA--[protein]-cysteine S-methyltransferase [Propionibacteriaceae bacterium]